MIEKLTIINTAVIIIFLIWELIVIVTGEERMGHLTDWMKKQEKINDKIFKLLNNKNGDLR